MCSGSPGNFVRAQLGAPNISLQPVGCDSLVLDIGLRSDGKTEIVKLTALRRRHSSSRRLQLSEIEGVDVAWSPTERQRLGLW